MLPIDDKLFAHRMVKKTDSFKSLTDANGRSLLLVRVNIIKSSNLEWTKENIVSNEVYFRLVLI